LRLTNLFYIERTRIAAYQESGIGKEEMKGLTLWSGHYF
jgi:hypothetical protein